MIKKMLFLVACVSSASLYADECFVHPEAVIVFTQNKCSIKGAKSVIAIEKDRSKHYGCWDTNPSNGSKVVVWSEYPDMFAEYPKDKVKYCEGEI